MALVMAISAVFALGAVVLAAALFLDARKWAGSRKRLVTVILYTAAGLSAAAAAGFAWLAAAVLDALLSIF